MILFRDISNKNKIGFIFNFHRFHMSSNFLKLFKNDLTRADLVACGSAAGLAAAFRSPVGGVMFLVEGIVSFWYRQLLWTAFFTTAIVSISLGFIGQLCSKHSCGYFRSLTIIFEIGKQGRVYAVRLKFIYFILCKV